MSRNIRFASLYTALLCAAMASLSAASFTWTGGGTGGNASDWSAKQNWSPSTTGHPGTGDQAVFTATVGNSSTPTLSVATTVGELTFNAGAAAFTIQGPFALSLEGITGLGLQNNATATETLNASSITLVNNQLWNNNGTLVVSSPISLGANTLTLGGSGTATLNGIISGGGGLSQSAGTVTLGGVNTYSGGTTLSGGTTHISSDNNLGNASGGITFSGGTLSPTATLTSSRGITLNGAGTISSSSDVTLNGAITGTGSLTQTGPGALNLGGGNNYSGGTTLNGGSINANSGTALGAGPVALNAGTLTLNNDITTAANDVTLGNANLTQGAATSNLNFTSLTTAGNGTINVGSSGVINFGTANYTSGLLTIAGWVGPAYDPNTLSTGASGSAAIFIQNQPSDTFLANVQFQGGYPQGAEWLNTVNGPGELVPVPEPSVYAAIFGLGLLGFAIARRRMFASA